MRISEIFFSLQGEGTEIGLPTVFVRLYGCDLRCRWCDTMYAVEGGRFEVLGVDDVYRRVACYGCARVCITGGEPLLQAGEVEALTRRLLDGGMLVVLETSGHRRPPAIFGDERCVISMDCKCPSSGMEGRMDPSLPGSLEEKDQLKFVLADRRDYDYALRILDERPTRAQVVFQPVGGSEARWIAEAVLKDGLHRVRVLPQLHKLLWGDRKGV